MSDGITFGSNNIPAFNQLIIADHATGTYKIIFGIMNSNIDVDSGYGIFIKHSSGSQRYKYVHTKSGTYTEFE